MKEFWTKNKKTILIVGGIVVAFVVGFFVFKKRK